jgi:micrococcal nuclease
MRALPRGARLLPLILLVAAIAGTAGAQPASLEGTVVRIVDGDTIHVRLADRVEKVRYIGVNTPEVHHPRKGEEPGGREAAEVNRQLVDNKHVRLELDVQSRDRYGRLLAYVWVAVGAAPPEGAGTAQSRGDQTDKWIMINAELVRLGYAQVMTVPPNVRYQELFLKLQRDAREAGRGLWKRV